MAIGSEGTVRGAFDLDTRPAQRAVRDYRREAARADAQTRQLGSSMDDAFGRQAGSISEMRGELAELRREAKAVESDLLPLMDRKTRAVKDQTQAVRTLRGELAALGRSRASPNVDVDGITRAIAQVETLHSRINALGRERATARVGVSGGFGSAARRAAAGAAAGGGGGQGGVLRSVSLGPLNLNPGPFLGALALGLPAGQGLLGAGAGVLGSAGAGALGGGAVGLAGGALGATGLAGILAVARPAQTALKEAIKLEQDWRDTVREHGRASKEAAEARRELNRALRDAPGARGAMHELTGFRRDWRRHTRPGRRDYYGMIRDVTRVGRRAAPTLAQGGNVATAALRGSAVDLAESVTRPEMLDHLSFFANRFARELPVAERSLEHSATAMARLARAAMPFFREGNAWVERWTGGWAESVKDQQETRAQMRDLVDSGKQWVRLLDSAWDLTKTIAGAGRPSGDSLVGGLTETFDRWDATLKANPAQTRQFFRDAATSTREMATAMKDFAGFLHEVADVLQPLFGRVMQLASLMSNFGLGAPGVGALMFGAYRGARGQPVGGGTGAMMFGRGAAPATAAGGANAAALVGAAAGSGVTGNMMSRYVTGTGSARPLTGARQMINMPEWRYGGPQSQLGARPSLFGRGGSMLAGAARGAGRAFWPVALGLGLLDFASFEGDFGQRAQAAASGATLGLIPRPMTSAQRDDRAAQTTASWVDENLYGLGSGRHGTTIAMSRISKEIADLQARNRGTSTYVDQTTNRVTTRSDLTDEEREENEERIRLLTRERDELRRVNREMDRMHDQRVRARQRQAGLQYGAGLPGAFREYRRAGMGPEEAARATAQQAGKKIGTIGQGGVEALGESSLQWARTVAKNAPALKGIVDDIADDIERRYRRMGRRIQIVNGDILTGSKREWRQIGHALADPIEVARQKVNDDFTAIQRKAIGSLRAMGFDGGQARQLVSALEGGGTPGQVARTNIAVGDAGGRTMLDPIPRGSGRRNRQARGGIVAGRGMMDSVPMGDGLVAPGEAWIANRHTMRDLSRASVAVYGFTAEQMIRGEHRRHGARGYARGGSVSLDGANPGMAGYARVGSNYGLTVSSGLRPGDTDSYHGQGWAIDLAGPASGMLSFARHAAKSWGSRLEELIHSPLGFGIKNGRRVAPYAVADHYDHVHLADVGGAGARLASGAAAGMALGNIRLRGVGRRQRGVPGLLRERAGDMHAAGLERRINQTLDRMGGGGGLAGFSGGGEPSANMKLGRRMMRQFWGMDQWPALRELWTRESHWDHTAVNPTSGAWGIPQSLPGSKMASAGRDWRSNPATQIAWGLGYIRDRYGSPQSALAFHDSHNWYSRGGRMAWAGGFANSGSFVTNGPTAFVAGEGHRRRERVTVHPVGATSNRTGGGGVQIGSLSVQVVIEGGIKSREDEDRIADRVGRKIAKKIGDAIDRGQTADVIG